jgi:hypothetical protein
LFRFLFAFSPILKFSLDITLVHVPPHFSFFRVTTSIFVPCCHESMPSRSPCRGKFIQLRCL